MLGSSQGYHRHYYAMQWFMSLAFVLLFTEHKGVDSTNTVYS